ncbi:NAD(P)/FAD-dependent oxidoreductase [Stygiolobus caldivivus]|uniref:Thioredoxin reductase n=1 Tax=Stygiolobus caldivivus TaxID=2824673 RepID=A0A8D5U8D7_9CREN|nr:FAD-dependent oxidoreductase [Stygiolobus caldivivus]BCU70629.1 thioredoxin reductase [Stygiolobus caldivivus]
MNSINENVYDVIIIGAGVAGLSAALYTARQKMKTLVVSKDLGGQLTLTELIENYPAVDSSSGIGLAQKIEKQARRFGANFIYGEEINKIEKEGDLFIIKGIKGEYKAKSLILAFGKTPRELHVKGEQELKGKGVSYCAICDAAFFKDKPAAVVGEGEPGLEAIELLSRYAKPAYYISRSNTLVGSDEEIVKSIVNNNNIKLYLGYTVREIQGDQKVSKIIISSIKDNKTEILDVDGVIIEMGYELKTDIVKGLVKLNEKGEIIVDELGRTSSEGIFAAGDVTSTPYKQAVVAAAEGVKAALSAYNYLRDKSGLPPVNVDWKAEKKKFAVQFRL